MNAAAAKKTAILIDFSSSLLFGEALSNVSVIYCTPPLLLCLSFCWLLLFFLFPLFVACFHFFPVGGFACLFPVSVSGTQRLFWFDIFFYLVWLLVIL